MMKYFFVLIILITLQIGKLILTLKILSGSIYTHFNLLNKYVIVNVKANSATVLIPMNGTWWAWTDVASTTYSSKYVTINYFMTIKNYSLRLTLLQHIIYHLQPIQPLLMIIVDLFLTFNSMGKKFLIHLDL